MFKRILLPTDGSPLSVQGTNTGIALASKLGASVHGLHVISPVSPMAYMAEPALFNLDALPEQMTDLARGYLAELRQRAEAAGLAYSGEYVTAAHTHQAIIEAATRQACDLIVMASHGWHGLDRLLLGSETHKVMLAGVLPVLVIPGASA